MTNGTWSLESRLSSDAYRHLLEVGEPVRVAAGQTLITEGASDTCFYIVRTGHLSVNKKVAGRDRELARVGPSDVVGEMAYMDDRPRSATVRAEEAAELIRLDQSKVTEHLAERPVDLVALTRALASRVSDRLRGSVDQKKIDAVITAVEALPISAKAKESEDLTQYLEQLHTEALTHRAVKHPYLNALATADLPDIEWAIRDFGKQYRGYSAHFPRYLTTVISKLERPDHRRKLLDNLAEEGGHYEGADLEALITHGIQPEWVQGIPHPELFNRFQVALGVPTPNAIEDDAVEVACWREVFYQILSTGTPAEAVGAIGLGTENIVASIYSQILKGVRRVSGLKREDYVFFELHCEVDDDHAHSLLEIARDLAASREGRAQLRKGMHKALGLRATFWDWMYERARTMPLQ